MSLRLFARPVFGVVNFLAARRGLAPAASGVRPRRAASQLTTPKTARANSAILLTALSF